MLWNASSSRKRVIFIICSAFQKLVQLLLQTEYSTVSLQHIWHPVGLSQSAVQRFGTYCLICCMIQPSSLNALGGT